MQSAAVEESERRARSAADEEDHKAKAKRPSTEAASGCGAEGDGREADCVRG
ncbi:MAG: hypothetical protein M3332_15880 [Actinomycetota bacterium]|nr:hypothetical protein [Actinomycetota bacterium]